MRATPLAVIAAKKHDFAGYSLAKAPESSYKSSPALEPDVRTSSAGTSASSWAPCGSTWCASETSSGTSSPKQRDSSPSSVVMRERRLER